MTKKKHSSNPEFLTLIIYGIWSKIERTIVFIGLQEEDVELEFDMENYSDETHSIVCLSTAYDISNLEE